MVAEMASCGAACHLEDGDGDVPALENKDHLSESDSSSSSSENGGTSAEDSSEEDEDKNKAEDDSEGCAEGDAGEEQEGRKEAKAEEREQSAEPEAAALNGRDDRFKLCCEKCKAIHQTHGSELVTPHRLSKGRFQLQLEEEGTYECSVTGLVFEASQRVLVRYSVLSWSKFGAFLPNSWKCAGPIFNVDTVDKDASALKSIQFPHSVCLAHPEEDMTFRVLHIKDNRPLLEPTSDHTGSHVKWNVSSLSPVGPILQTNGAVEHHGVVLVYKQLCSDANSYSFHVYLATNSASDIKDIGKQVRGYKNRYLRIDKPPTCKLDEGTYRLLSKPEGEIKPQDLKFTLAVTKMKGYFEAFFEQPPPFKLSLIEINTEQTVWDATIREGDCVENVEKKPRKRTICRQRSSSPSEEETACKRPRWQDESDGLKAVMPQDQDLSDKQLLRVSKQLGMEWKQVAIFLGLEYRELDDIQAAEKEVNMQKLKMLLVWKKRRRPGEATAAHLLKNLEEVEEVPNEVYQILKDMSDNRAAK
ncbi:uncharacterized protein si:dkeyp-97b10.3 isoform X2 [Kryptolebias marmoratus]|uniref:uncharacterized protein si:dkeyp-97b10.3 isoform X2 n=1 Tax=Kryptolebias marmoratus TaxID=37003 RepID=UPI0018ACAFA2|nr:uncharacterized protein si:dkeyp-97b10.3 isoform X2 [Kryptolebias marmoratus]